MGTTVCGLESPATGSNLQARVRLEPPRRAGLQQRRPARVVQRQGRTASRNRRFADIEHGSPSGKRFAVDRAAKKELVTTLNGVFKDTTVVVVAHYSG